MICKNCGFENNDNANFCANCGSDLRQKEPDQETVQEPVQPEEETLTVEAEEVPADQADASKETGFILVDSNEPAPVQEDSLLQTVSAQTERLKEEENPAKEEEPEQQETQPAAEEPVKWYYVDKGQSRGPFDEELFEEMAANGTISGRTYIWKPGMENWALLEDTDFGKNLMQAQSQAQEPEPAADPLASLEEKNRRAQEQDDSLYFHQAAGPEPAQDASANQNVQDAAGSEWFYVQNSRSSGPYADEVMGQFVRNGLIDANTYVWKEGMSDWQHLGNTALSRYLPRSSQSQTSYGQGAPRPQSGWNAQYSAPYAPYGVKEHSVILYLVLYFCTCSLFNLFWIYQMAKDVDALAAGSNRPRGVDPVLAVILDVVTCGLFKVYFYWKEGTVLAGIMNQPGSDQSVLLAVLGLFCPVASSAILQDQINTALRSR